MQAPQAPWLIILTKNIKWDTNLVCYIQLFGCNVMVCAWSYGSILCLPWFMALWEACSLLREKRGRINLRKRGGKGEVEGEEGEAVFGI